MNLIDRYLALAAARATLAVMVVLLALIGFISLTGQLEDVGKGNFQAVDAFLVVVAQWPRNAFDIFPIAALLGGMMGLGALAKHSELVAVRRASACGGWPSRCCSPAACSRRRPPRWVSSSCRRRSALPTITRTS
jgi:lipopolysaccharide export LptBFGC system permease protein LptF